MPKSEGRFVRPQSAKGIGYFMEKPMPVDYLRDVLTRLPHMTNHQVGNYTGKSGAR